MALLSRAGVAPGARCLEVACGGGDLACDMARLVGPAGSVLGTDVDVPQLDIARAEALAQGLGNLQFECSDITQDPITEAFDVIHVRFLLTHLADPVAAVAKLVAALKVGGVLIVEDIDFHGQFAYPPLPAADRYSELYTRTVQARGGDPFIGCRLPSMLLAAGLDAVEVQVSHPVGLAGEVKLVTPITMENIAEAVVGAALASRAEVDQIVDALYAFARAPDTLLSCPRIVQTWGRRTATR